MSITAPPPSTPPTALRSTGSWRTLGGVAALVEAATYVVGFALLLAVLVPAGYGGGDPAQAVAVQVAHEGLLRVWYAVIYLVAGASLVVLVLALDERSGAGSSVVARTATAFGLIWSGLVLASGMVANVGLSTVTGLYEDDQDRAVSVWSAVTAVQEGLGGGNELVGGLWVLLLSGSALRAGGLPRVLNHLGVVIGLAGVLTVVPALGAVGYVFGIGFIVWYVGVGVVLLRGGPGPAAERARDVGASGSTVAVAGRSRRRP